MGFLTCSLCIIPKPESTQPLIFLIVFFSLNMWFPVCNSDGSLPCHSCLRIIWGEIAMFTHRLTGASRINFLFFEIVINYSIFPFPLLPSSPSVYTPCFKLSLHAYNITCSVHILLPACLLSWLTVWHWTANCCARPWGGNSSCSQFFSIVYGSLLG